MPSGGDLFELQFMLLWNAGFDLRVEWFLWHDVPSCATLRSCAASPFREFLLTVGPFVAQCAPMKLAKSEEIKARVDKPTKDTLQKLAEERGLDTSDLIRMAVRRFITTESKASNSLIAA